MSKPFRAPAATLPRSIRLLSTPTALVALFGALVLLATAFFPTPVAAARHTPQSHSTTPHANPHLPNTCGLNVAIALDLSGSLSTSDVTASKDAAKQVVRGLQGTPSSVGLYTFATFAPDRTNADIPLGRTSVASADGADDAVAAIDKLRAVDSRYAGTNWDRGLAQIGAGYDLLLFVTDGKPTAYGTPSKEKGSTNTDFGVTTEAIDIDRAVQSANEHKAHGTRIEALGVGSDVDAANLAKISGTTQGQDYYKVSDYDDLGTKLKDAALKSCQGTVTISAGIAQSTGEPQPGSESEPGSEPRPGNTPRPDSAPLPAAGWKFSTPGGRPESVTTSANGLATVSYPGGSRVKISSRPQDGFTLQQVDGRNAVCTDAEGKSLGVSDSGPSSFALEKKLGRTDVVKCAVVFTRDSVEPTPAPSQASDPCPKVAGVEDDGAQDGTGAIAWCVLNMSSDDPSDAKWLLPGSAWKLTGPDGTYAIVTDNGGNDFDPAPGRIRVGKLSEGEYSLKQVTAPKGFVLPEGTAPFTISAATPDNGFVYRQIFNIPDE